MRLNRHRSLDFLNRETKDWKTTTDKKKQKETIHLPARTGKKDW